LARRSRDADVTGGNPGIKRDLGYHYSRRERLSLESAPPPRPEGGFFRRNRHLVIILLDLLILVLLFYGLRAFLSGQEERARLAGYQLTLRGFPYEEVVLASVSVKRISRQPRGEYTTIRVRFQLEAGGEAVEAEALLPEEAGGEIMLRQALPAPRRGETLLADVVLSGEGSLAERSDRLSTDLER
jgi:hypothetical protein